MTVVEAFKIYNKEREREREQFSYNKKTTKLDILCSQQINLILMTEWQFLIDKEINREPVVLGSNEKEPQCWSDIILSVYYYSITPADNQRLYG